MALVKDNMLAITQRIDPYTKAGVALDSTTVLSTDGDRFTAQEKVDLYNQARFTLFGVLAEKYGDKVRDKIREVLIQKSDFQFTVTDGIAISTKPAGFLWAESLMNVSLVPIILLPIDKVQAVRSGTNPHYTQSASKIFAFEVGNGIYSYGTAGVNSGNSFVTALSTYILTYYGLTTWTTSSGSSTEQFSDEYNWILIETAVKLSEDIGSGQAYNFVRSLLQSQAN